jgi:hypothetical protein
MGEEKVGAKWLSTSTVGNRTVRRRGTDSGLESLFTQVKSTQGAKAAKLSSVGVGTPEETCSLGEQGPSVPCLIVDRGVPTPVFLCSGEAETKVPHSRTEIEILCLVCSHDKLRF